MILCLNEIEVECVIGERPDERDRLQRLLIDVELGIGDLVAETDELDDTVDYAALAERIRETLINARCRMIERAAGLVASVCAADGKADFVRVKVTKTGAIAHLASASAVFEWTRNA